MNDDIKRYSIDEVNNIMKEWDNTTYFRFIFANDQNGRDLLTKQEQPQERYKKLISEIYKNEPTREYSREEVIDYLVNH